MRWVCSHGPDVAIVLRGGLYEWCRQCGALRRRDRIDVRWTLPAFQLVEAAKAPEPRPAPCPPHPRPKPQPRPTTPVPMRERVLAAFDGKNRTRALSLKDVAEAVGITYQQAANAMTVAIRDGKVIRVGMGVYRLSEDPPEAA